MAIRGRGPKRNRDVPREYRRTVVTHVWERGGYWSSMDFKGKQGRSNRWLVHPCGERPLVPVLLYGHRRRAHAVPNRLRRRQLRTVQHQNQVRSWDAAAAGQWVPVGTDCCLRVQLVIRNASMGTSRCPTGNGELMSAAYSMFIKLRYL